ncbi:unnamed protein product [Camellia sinensis]
MDSKYERWSLVVVGLLLMMMVGFAESDLAKDREECATQLVGLSTCLPYVEGKATGAPTLDCCTGLKQVLQNSKKCLCILVKDRNDPSLGLKINATLALGLPTACHTPANISQCPALLNLAPNSPDAKVFEDFVNSTKGSNSTPAANGNSTRNGSISEIKSEGERAKRWVVVEMVGVVITCMIVHILPSL